MKLKGNPEQLVRAAAEGATYAQIARVAGVSVATVKRRLQDPEIAQEVREARHQQRREHVGQLSVIAAEAIQRLRELVHSDDPHVASRAVALTLRTLVTLGPQVEVEERLAELEAAVAEQDRDTEDDD